MNPELQRNIWLSLTPWRLIGMPVVLGMVFFSVGSFATGDWLDVVAPVAQTVYVVLVIVWGTWRAARAVVGEIRDRTWDGQRLSTLGPWTMLWGKLFGSTIYVWYGGVICLAVLLTHSLYEKGVGGFFFDLAYYVSIGMFAHTVTFLASMLAVRRRSGHPRLEVFFYQIAGLIAAWLAWEILAMIRDGVIAGDMVWLGYRLPATQFFLWSLVAFVLWAFVGCYRLMRAELQMSASPWLWLVFMAFMMVYAAGFADRLGFVGQPLIFLRLLLAFLMAAILTYVMVFSEMKDWVRYRRILGHLMKGRLVSVLGQMQSWMFAFIAVVGISLVMLAVGGGRIDFAFVPDQSLLQFFMKIPPQFSGTRISFILDTAGLAFAGAAFVFRDLGLILFFNTGRNARRGDFAALITLFVLYAVLPGIFRAAGLLDFLPVLSPLWPVIEKTGESAVRIAFDWDRVIWPLIQAGLVWTVLIARARSSGKLVARAA